MNAKLCDIIDSCLLSYGIYEANFFVSIIRPKEIWKRNYREIWRWRSKQTLVRYLICSWSHEELDDTRMGFKLGYTGRIMWGRLEAHRERDVLKHRYLTAHRPLFHKKKITTLLIFSRRTFCWLRLRKTLTLFPFLHKVYHLPCSYLPIHFSRFKAVLPGFKLLQYIFSISSC